MTETLLSTYRTKIRSLEIIPSSGGCFEVTVDGKKIFSKLATGRFPEQDEILSHLDDRAAAA